MWDGKFSSLWRSDNIGGMTNIIVGGWVLLAFLWCVRESIIRYIAPKHAVHVRKEIYAALMRRYEQEYEEIPGGDVIVRILRISELYVYKSEWVLQDMIPYGIGYGIFILYCFKVHWKIGAAVVSGSALTGIGVAALTTALLNASDNREAKLLESSQNMTDSFSNLMNVYINNETTNEIERGKKWQDMYGESWLSEMRVARNMNIITMSTTVLTFGVVFGIIIALMKQNKISGLMGGSLIVIYVIFINWMQSLFLALPQSLKRLGTLQNAMPFLKNIFRNTAAENRTVRSGIKDGAIVFENVTFQYPKAKTKKPVLKEFSVRIDNREKVAIVGQSGSGKTTVIKLLLQLYQQQSGSITIGGQDATKLELEYLRNSVNYVNQRTTMHDIPIVDNILFGNTHTTVKDVETMLETYHLTSIFASIGGIHASAGISGANLSLGMQKCVLVLRGVLKRGFVIVFDEPVAGLDAETSKKIMNLIQHTCKDRTVICITHKSEAVQQFVNRTIVFKQIA